MTTGEASYGIRNFRPVYPGLYRGGQPDLAAVGRLKELGVTTVVSLRSGRRAVELEKRAVEAAGMKFVSVPINYFHLPKQEAINELLSLLDENRLYPIFIHCFHGVDRTGLIIALYRMTRQGWSFERAYEEMKRCGFHRFRLRHFKWLLESYALRIGQVHYADTVALRNNQKGVSVKRL